MKHTTSHQHRAHLFHACNQDKQARRSDLTSIGHMRRLPTSKHAERGLQHETCATNINTYKYCTIFLNSPPSRSSTSLTTTSWKSSRSRGRRRWRAHLFRFCLIERNALTDSAMESSSWLSSLHSADPYPSSTGPGIGMPSDVEVQMSWWSRSGFT